VGKYADHLPLYRQAQIYARQGIVLDRSTLADWVGRAAWFLRAFHERLLDDLRASTKLFADETTAPVLDRGRGRTKTGQLWAYARDDRPWGGTAPPPVAYVYAPDRKSDRPVSISKDSAPCCRSTAMPWPPLAVQLAFCWAHWRRKFYEIAQAGNAPVATEALGRIVAIYAIEAEMRGQEAEARRNVRQQRAKPLVEELKTWLEVRLAAVSRKSTIAEAIRYGLGRWDGLVRFLDDGGSRSTPTSSSAPSARLPSITRTRSSPDQMAVASNGPPSRH
jgi:transposase